MMWLSAAPAIIVAGGVLLLPGLLVAWILRMRGIWLWGFAGPASVSIVAMTSVLTPVIGLGWSILAYAGSSIVLAVVALVLRITLLRAREPQRVPEGRNRLRRSLILPAGLLLGGLLIAAQLVLIIRSPDNISQSFDNVFHLNAVRFVMDTANASPFHVGQMTGEGLWFYPAAWHGAVALVALASGASIPLASNAVLFIAAAVIWPASIVLLTRVLTAGRVWVDAAAGVLAAALSAFPFLPADYGVLYPYLLAVAILPPAVAASVVAFRLGRGATPAFGAVVVVLLGSLPGLALAHPGGFTAWMVATVVCAVVAYAVLMRSSPAARTRVVASVALGLFALIVAAIGYVLRPAVEARGWPPAGSVGQAAGEVIFVSPHYAAVPLAVAVLFWIGTFATLRQRTRGGVTALALLAVFGILYVVAQAWPWPTIRDVITGPWYNDANRLAALLPMVVIPLASAGVMIAAGLLVKAWRQRTVILGVAVVASLAVLGVFQLHSALVTKRVASQSYDYRADSPLLSTDELVLLERLATEVAEGDVIAGNPWTGTSLAYAFANRRVLMPHILMEVSADEELINDELHDAEPGDPVCDALDRTGVEYVLDFGSIEVHGGEHRFPGLENLSESRAVRLADSEGSARLYQIVGCEE